PPGLPSPTPRRRPRISPAPRTPASPSCSSWASSGSPPCRTAPAQRRSCGPGRRPSSAGEESRPSGGGRARRELLAEERKHGLRNALWIILEGPVSAVLEYLDVLHIEEL